MTSALPKIFEDHENFVLFMLFRHRTDTTITPDTLFEAKGPFEDSRIFKILEISGIFYGKSYSNENQWIFNRKPIVFHEKSPVGSARGLTARQRPNEEQT